MSSAKSKRAKHCVHIWSPPSTDGRYCLICDQHNSYLDVTTRAIGRGPESDPKGNAGRQKPGFANIPAAVMVLVDEVLRQGGVKYGFYNWADERMKASTYHNAINRHEELWWLSQDTDDESAVFHHAHLIACSIIIIMQTLKGKLIDDRPKSLSIEEYKKACEMVKNARANFAKVRKAQELPTGEE